MFLNLFEWNIIYGYSPLWIHGIWTNTRTALNTIMDNNLLKSSLSPGTTKLFLHRKPKPRAISLYIDIWMVHASILYMYFDIKMAKCARKKEQNLTFIKEKNVFRIHPFVSSYWRGTLTWNLLCVISQWNLTSNIFSENITKLKWCPQAVSLL